MNVNVNVNCTPVFWANKRAYEEKKYRVIANQGSTRSSKSYSLCQLMIDISTTQKKHISIVSPSLPHLKKGVRKDVLDILNNLQIFNESDFNRTDNIYKFPSTGSYIEFFGVEDAGKVRGPGRDILYINEANLISQDSYIQLALRTRETIFIDFNPADEYSWVYDVSDKEGNKLIISTYKNNLANLAKFQIEEIENLQYADENLWKVYGLGLRGTSSETIYTHWKIKEFPQCDSIAFGLDFGFNHPTALIKVGFLDGAVYAEEVLYESKLTNSDLAYLIKSIGVVNKSIPIYCDTARPEAIEEIRKAGLNTLPAVKDVFDGIKMVKSMPLFITPNSTNLLKEIKNYKWAKDKDGRVLEQPVKFMDDAVDAMRYAIYSYMKRSKRTYAGATY